ncbi:prepilin peptidase [Variovorax ginsengisoli]|uniref:Prepilin leader peptidase/N-methyltransferase n=1 Tax=Variovorax ginsengisoli TaxID=363844 RepID=A0ABT9S2K5_9BURK|nr:A24 family peptidase [Variovorax ginsengisoli]MDP9898575.1 leader peptidase (prepilin peptidase)/N-methyltransferase [Variovorax ginsengisoli]
MLMSPSIDAALAGLIGLLIGSFLNVVVHRLPKMLEHQWAADTAAGDAPALPSYNLMTPPSHCAACGHAIRWYENLPVLSYVALRGRCAACRAPIGVRHPLVELTTAALFAWCVWRMPGQWAALAWCGFAAVLLVLALIDWDTTLLPDDLTLPLLWAGLLCALAGFTGVDIAQAVLGAAAGYLSLWSVYWLFKLVTGKEGMGYGDFKLFAALGAWFGWQALIPMVLMASVIGVVVGLGMKAVGGLREGGYIPFGPFLAGAGFAAMLFGPHAILRVAGL